jgi:carbonic anhydrase
MPAHLRCDVLCELNVIEQVVNVAHTTVVRDAWARGQKLTLHGWVYGLGDGLLKDLQMTVPGTEWLDGLYRVAVARVSEVDRDPPA